MDTTFLLTKIDEENKNKAIIKARLRNTTLTEELNKVVNKFLIKYIEDK